MNIFRRIWNLCWWICYSESYDEWKMLVKEKEQELIEEIASLEELLREENDIN